MRKLFQGSRIKVYVSWAHSPLQSTALPPESVCETSEYKAATIVVCPPKAIAIQRQSNSRLLVDSTSIRLANGDCCRESCPLFSVLRHHAFSSPICLSEGVKQALRLIASIPLSSGGKSVLLMKKKAPSRSGFPQSMHVVLKTRHVNPNIHVRRY